MEKKQLNKFSGTFMFASLNSCRGYNKSRRDDIESALYLLSYLLNQCNLPWTSIKRDTMKFNFTDAIKQRLNISNVRQLVSGLPEFLVRIYCKALTMTFKQKPDYDLFTTHLLN